MSNWRFESTFVEVQNTLDSSIEIVFFFQFVGDIAIDSYGS